MLDSISQLPTDDLVAELIRRRTAIDDALESAHVWETRQSRILAVCASAWGLTPGRIFTRSRTARVVNARRMSGALLCAQGFTHAEIAGLFGMDVSSITTTARRHRENLEADAEYTRRWHLVNDQLAETPTP